MSEVVVIGGGLNGLVAATILARRGVPTTLLEARAEVGGAAEVGVIVPGFRCPTLSHAGADLQAVASLLDLSLQGSAPAHLVGLDLEGRSLVCTDDGLAGQPTSSRDHEGYGRFLLVLRELASVVRTLDRVTPPSLDRVRAGELLPLAATARRFRRLGRSDAYRLLRFVPMPVADLVAEFMEDALLRGVFAAHGVFGSFLGPRSAASGAVLLLRAATQWPLAGVGPAGGPGRFVARLAECATRAGVTIRTRSAVTSIEVEGTRIQAVRLASGERIPADRIAAAIDPKQAFLRLIDPEHLAPEFLRRVRNIRANGTLAKVNLALSALPAFRGLRVPESGAHPLAGRVIVAPDIDYIERAFDHAKYGEPSARPVLELTFPSLTDPSLAPKGAHVASIYAQFAPYHLKGATWDEEREALGDTVVALLATLAPDLPQLVVGRQVLTPLDLEREHGISGGHIHHGELALDQLFTMRPFLGCARYRTPIEGLYLCSAGTHPGTGLNGLSGANAAREVLKDMRRR